MIQSFADNRTKRVYNGEFELSVSTSVKKRAKSKLDRINFASNLGDLNMPFGNRLEKLRGNRNGQYSIRVSKSWRICFYWKDGDAYKVELNHHYS